MLLNFVRWIEDNSKVDDSFTNWGDGQPNGGDTENCLAMDDTDGTWHDYPCKEQKYYVCSKPNSTHMSITTVYAYEIQF